MNINQKISAIAAGGLHVPADRTRHSERMRSSTSMGMGVGADAIGGLDGRMRDLLVVGTQTNLLAYDVEQYLCS